MVYSEIFLLAIWAEVQLSDVGSAVNFCLLSYLRSCIFVLLL
jgi:hypothetical protein